jgi:hypothetical protein
MANKKKIKKRKSLAEALRKKILSQRVIEDDIQQVSKEATQAVDALQGVSPPPQQQMWKWEPPLDKQLDEKVEALNDIIELADQIKDPECFRRFARKIARANAHLRAVTKITFSVDGSNGPTGFGIAATGAGGAGGSRDPLP